MSWPFLIPVAVAAAILNGILNGLAVARWPRTAGLHWSERARRLYPIQVSAVLGLFATAACAGNMARWIWDGSWNTTLLFGVAGFVGGLAGNYLPSRRCHPGLTLRDYVGGCLKAWTFPVGLVASAPLLSWGMGPGWSLQSGVVAGLYLGAYLGFVTVGWIELMRRCGAFTAVPPAIEALVREQASARKIAVNEVLFLRDFRALAFALPIQRMVVLTPRLVDLLTPEELRALVDHELAHLGESRAVLIGRVLGAMAFAPVAFLGVATTWYGIAGLAGCYGIWIILSFGARRLARAMEVRADRFAAEPPEAGAIYARALEKVYAENLIPASGIARGQAHPDLYDRMLAAGIQPDFDRPAKPHAANWTFLVWIVLFLALLAFVAVTTGKAP